MIKNPLRFISSKLREEEIADNRFVAAKTSKQRHIKLPQVISAKTNLEREKQCLNYLITKLEEKKALRGNTKVAR